MFNGILDELKEVKYLKEIIDFSKKIKCLKSLRKAEAYLQHRRASTTERFCEYT